MHHSFKEHTDAVTAMALSSDEKSFYSGGEDCQVLVSEVLFTRLVLIE